MTTPNELRAIAEAALPWTGRSEVMLVLNDFLTTFDPPTVLRLLADLEAAEARVGVLGKLLTRSGAYMQPPRVAHYRFAEAWRDARQTYDTLLAETRTALANAEEKP